jgi:hypothetical protein
MKTKMLLIMILLAFRLSGWGQEDSIQIQSRIDYIQEEIDITTKEWEEANKKGSGLINFQGSKWEKVRTEKKMILDSLISEKSRLAESLKIKEVRDTVIIMQEMEKNPSSYFLALNVKRFASYKPYYDWKKKAFIIPYPVGEKLSKKAEEIKKVFKKEFFVLSLDFILDSMKIESNRDITIPVNIKGLKTTINIKNADYTKFDAPWSGNIGELITIIGNDGQEAFHFTPIPESIKTIIRKRMKEKIKRGEVEDSPF